MTDIEKIRTEIEKAYNEAQNRVKLVKDEYWEGKVDSYRNVLCIFDSLQEEPVSEIDFKQELYKAFGRVKDFTLGMQIAKWFYDMGRKYHEPVSSLDNGDMPIERWKQAVEAASNQRSYRSSKGLTETRDDYFVDGVQWADEHPKKEHVSEEWIEELRTKLDSLSKKDFKKVFDKYAVDFNEETVSEDLEDEIIRYIGYPQEVDEDVSTTMIRKAARHFANWQKQQDSKLPKIWPRDTIEEYAYQCAYDLSNDWAKETPEWNDVQNACILGAQWQKEHLWRSANGDDLPEIDREVIVLIQEYPDDKDHLRVAFAHRPSKYAKVCNSNLGEEQVIEIEGYDKGRWNIPDVKFWLDVELPKEIEL